MRPWQCGWRADFSLSAMVEPDVAHNLIELYCTEGLLGSTFALFTMCQVYLPNCGPKVSE